MFTLPGKLYFIEAGPAGSLTAGALELLKQADLVAHDEAVPPEVLELIPARTAVYAVNGHGEAGNATREEARKRVIDAVKHGQTAIFLAGGETSSVREEIEALRRAGVVVEIASAKAAAAVGASLGAS